MSLPAPHAHAFWPFFSGTFAWVLALSVGANLSACVSDGTPTWNADVAPIMAEHCGGCHQAGNIAPFSLRTYEEARPLAHVIASITASGEMPPWDAQETEECSPEVVWKGDPRLSEAEIQTLAAWAEAGAPEGDISTAQALAPHAEAHLASVSARIQPAQAYTVDGDSDLFRCFILDPELESPRYLQGVEVIPGNTEVVHHVIVWATTEGVVEAAGLGDQYDCFGGPGLSGSMIGGWVPGAGPLEYPQDSGLLLSEDARLVMQVHYFPNGSLAEDLTAVDVSWVEEEPSRTVLIELEGNAASAFQGLQSGPYDLGGEPEFLIPEDTEDHTELIRIPLDASIPEVSLWMAAPHMHLAGVEMRIWVEREFGADETCLVHVPEWDFYWQRLYQYDEEQMALPTIKGGDTLVMECRYDTTVSNRALFSMVENLGIDSPGEIRLGEGSLDEMCLGVFGVVY